MKVRGQVQMDVARAREFRAEGLSWREIGIQLAEEAWRCMAYQAASVQNACSPNLQENGRAWREARKSRESVE